MKTVKTNLIVLLMLTFFLLIGCDNPTNPPPTSGTISGTVTFPVSTDENINDQWPTTSQISIGLYVSWPPMGVPDTSNIDVTDLNTSNQYNYIFDDLVFGTYEGIAITWEDLTDTNPNTKHHILGTNGGTYSFLPYYTGNGTNPDPVTVSEAEPSITGIDFSADLKYVNACSKIENQIECEAQKDVNDQSYCIWLPAFSMGPSQTTDQCM